MYVSIVSAVSWYMHATYSYMDTLPLTEFFNSIHRLELMLQEVGLCKVLFKSPKASSEVNEKQNERKSGNCFHCKCYREASDLSFYIEFDFKSS